MKLTKNISTTTHLDNISKSLFNKSYNTLDRNSRDVVFAQFKSERI